MEHFPECLKPEIAQLAQAYYAMRVQAGLPEDPLQDWLDAEHAVMVSHRSSPARLLPGGDLFPYRQDA